MILLRLRIGFSAAFHRFVRFPPLSEKTNRICGEAIPSAAALMNDPIYNTLMSVGAGVALLLLVSIGFRMIRGGHVNRGAHAVAFAAIGVLLAFLGAVMTVTWPLSGPTAFDNIVFGEPVLAMGVLLVAGSYLLGSQRFWSLSPAEDNLAGTSWSHLAGLLRPLSWFGAAMGLGLIAIAFVGPVYSPWEAPPQEPISSEFSNTEWLENGFISALYLLTGLGAVLLPFALGKDTLTKAKGLLKVIGAFWAITGTAFVLFGALNYYTHIGLTINSYEESQQQPQSVRQAQQ
jgi:uncharacterized membrane protein